MPLSYVPAWLIHIENRSVPVQGRAGKYSVGKDGKDLGGTCLYKFVHSAADGSAGVSHIVHKDGNSILDISHQCHACDFIGFLPLLVDERKLYI